MRGCRLHEALHGPQLAPQARQEPLGGGAASVPSVQGPGERRQEEHLARFGHGGGSGGGGSGSRRRRLAVVGSLLAVAAAAGDVDPARRRRRGGGHVPTPERVDVVRRGAAVRRNLRVGGQGDRDKR